MQINWGDHVYSQRFLQAKMRLGLILIWVVGGILMPVDAISSPKAFSQTLSLAEQALIEQAHQQVRQGLKAYQNQQLNEAINLWEQALILYQQLDAGYHQSVTLNFLGAAYISLGQTAQAHEFLQQALRLSQQIYSLILQAQILGNLGITYRNQGRYVQALDVYEQALDLMHQRQDPEGEAHILSLLGNVHESLGEYDLAVDYNQQALKIAQQQQDWLLETTALNNLGGIFSIQGNYAQAIVHFQQSEKISLIYHDLPGLAHTSINLGSAYYTLDDLDQAINYYREGLQIARSLGNDHLESQLLSSLGLIYNDLGNTTQALEHLDRSLAIATEVADPRAIALTLNNFGHVLYTSGQLNAAKVKLYEAINSLESLRPGLDDQYKVSVFDTQVIIYNFLQKVLIAQGDIETALEIAERSRARAFVELIASRSNSALPSMNGQAPTIDQIRRIAEEQQAVLVEYTLVSDDSFKFQGKQRGTASSLYIWVVQPTGQVDFRNVDLRPLQQEKGLSIAKLVETSRALSGFRGTRGEAHLQPGDQVRREGEPLDWAPYEVTAIDSRASVTLSHPDFVLPNPIVPISEVYKINASAFAPTLRRPQHWQDLHQLLIEPITDLLPTDPEARVVFIPQEQLFLVPFPALQADDGSYLIEHHTILTAPAIQILGLTNRNNNHSLAEQTVVRPERPPIEQPLVVGNPTMPENLQPLPHAATEANGIANFLSTRALTGDTATETAIKQQLPTASLIHLATHGFFNESNPLQGSLAFAPSDDQDGFLTAEEILTQTLRAELVVLSACDTGRGQITGDGVIGLSRSFLAAGADNVMVSLWQVPDDATAELMIEFYRQRQHLDNAQALRQAMLTTRQNYENPLAWAAFTLIGAAE